METSKRQQSDEHGTEIVLFKGLTANAADRDSDAEIESNAYADIACNLQSCEASA